MAKKFEPNNWSSYDTRLWGVGTYLRSRFYDKRINGVERRLRALGLKKIMISWWEPRKCWRKFVKGKTYYLPGTGSRQCSELSAVTALEQLADILESERKKRQADILDFSI